MAEPTCSFCSAANRMLFYKRNTFICEDCIKFCNAVAARREELNGIRVIGQRGR